MYFMLHFQKYHHRLLFQYFLKIIILVGCAMFSSISLGEEEDPDTGPLRIISTTDDCSADIYIREETEEVSDEEKDKDRERSRLGIGEVVQLKLNGKPALIGDISKIEWSIKEGGGLACFCGAATGVRFVYLQIKDDLKSNGKIKVGVIVETGEEREIAFTAVVPNGITAQHVRISYDPEDPGFHQRGMRVTDAKYSTPEDGDTTIAGASALLELTVLPKDVSFNNIKIVERDGGCNPKPDPKVNIASEHIPNFKKRTPTKKNGLSDRIASYIPVNKLLGYSFPQIWIWECNWVNCCESGEEIQTIPSVDQKFSYERDKDGNFKVTISKFGCSVSRTTAPGNKHIFE